MNANEVNVVIDNLCDKLGIAANNIAQLVPSLAKMHIITNGIWLIVFVSLSIMFFYLACKAKRAEELESIDDIGWKLVLFVLAILCLFFAVFPLLSLVEWAVAPNVKAIEHIIYMIGE